MIELLNCPHGGGLAHLIVDIVTWLAPSGGLLYAIKLWSAGRKHVHNEKCKHVGQEDAPAQLEGAQERTAQEEP